MLIRSAILDTTTRILQNRSECDTCDCCINNKCEESSKCSTNTLILMLVIALIIAGLVFTGVLCHILLKMERIRKKNEE